MCRTPQGIGSGREYMSKMFTSLNFFTTSNQCIYTCRSCLQNISFVYFKPCPAELINPFCRTQNLHKILFPLQIMNQIFVAL